MALQGAVGAVSAQPTTRNPLRVMVVDDSVVIRGLISRWVDSDPDLETVAKCENGQVAVDSVATARPDVVVLDIEMPVMDGLTALKLLLQAKPRPHVIMASTLTKRNAAITMRALAEGATECVPKPDSISGVTTSTEFRRELIGKIRALGGFDQPVTPAPAPAAAPARDSGAPAPDDGKAIQLVPFNRGIPSILAVGSSTGGPKALSTLLGSIGPHLGKIVTVITQHMPPTFTELLAANLAGASGLRAKEAEHREAAAPGTIYVAPGGKHLIVRQVSTGQRVLELDDRPPVNFTKPSADVMFQSLAEACGHSVLTVVLTGLGRDGADGAVAIRKAGGNVIAQDEATSVVWGMPGATAQAGVCSAVLPIENIGPRVARLLSGVTS